jgi:catechol-2,3-dioxygenase
VPETASVPPPLAGVDHVHVFVADREAAEAWYAHVLGMARVEELALWAVDGGPLTLADKAGTVHVALFERPRQACRSTIALGVGADDFLAWQRHLAAALGRPVDAVDHEKSWSLYFEDPDGNPYEITSYEYDALAGRIRRA